MIILFPFRLHRSGCRDGSRRRAAVLAAAALLAALAALPAVSRPGRSNASREDASRSRGEAYTQLMEAYLAAVNGDVDRGSQLLLRGANLWKDDAGYLGQAADLLLRMHRTEDAERTAHQALDIDGNEPWALRVLAEITVRRCAADPGNGELRTKAIRLLERLAQQKQEGPVFRSGVHRMLAELKSAGGDLEGAIEEARKQMERAPADPENRRYLVGLLLRAGRPAEGFDVVRGFLVDNPKALPLLPILAMTAGQAGRWGDAIPVLRKMAEANPGSVEVTRLLGEALLRVGRAAEAIPELEKATAGGEPAIETRFQLSVAYGETGRLADATAVAEKLVADQPGEPAFRSLLAESLAAQGRVEEALAAFRKTLDLLAGAENPGAPRQRDQNRLRMAGILLSRERVREAEDVLAGIERKDAPDALEMTGRVALELHEASRVRRTAVRLRQAGEEGIAAWLEGALALQEGKVEKASELFSRAVRVMGNGILLRTADLFRKAGHPEAGRRLLQNSVGEHPESAELHYYLGAFLDLSGDFTAAERELREAIRLDPRNSRALNHLGYSLAERNERLDEALALVRRALEVEPWEAAYLDSLGWTYFRMGRYEAAREPLEQAARDLPQDSVVHEHLGDVYQALGWSDQAISAWKGAIKAGAEDAEAIRAKIRAAAHTPARASDPPAKGGGGGSPRARR